MSDSKYMIDDNSADTFENLYRLIMSAGIKDTDKINDSASASSEYFGEILKKYCNDKLNNEESCNLLRFVNSYNMSMTNYLIKNFYSKVIGLHEIMNENSIINIITDRIYEYIIKNEKTLSAGGRYNINLSITSEFDKKKIIKDYIVYFLFDLSFKQVLIGKYGTTPKKSLIILPSGEMTTKTDDTYSGLFVNNSSKCMIPQIFDKNLVGYGKNDIDIGNEIDTWKYVVDTDENGNIIKKSIKNASNDVIYSFEKKFDIKNSNVIYTIVKSVILTGTYNETNPQYFTKKSPVFINFQQFLIHVFPISINNDNYNTVKDSATEREITIYTNRFPFSFIELHNIDVKSLLIKENGLNKDEYKDESAVKKEFPFIYDIFKPEQLRAQPFKNKVSFIVCYKEINNVYREFEYCQYTDILYSYVVNYYSDAKDTNIFSAPNMFFANITDSQKSSITNNVKNIISMPFKEEDTFNYIKDTVYDIVGCLRTNSFLALDLPESGIITYFAGNNKKYALGYGDTKSEQEEINDFLLVYENVRHFYYSTLSSKAFTNDDYYNAYEKMFIAVMAIIKTLDYKAENYREIDKMNMTDINNFLESYGLGVVVKYKNFMNQEDYKRQLIRHYNDLMKTKGSKEVIDILSKVFDVANTDINIRKYELVGNHGDVKTLAYDESITNKIDITPTDSSGIFDIKYYDSTIREDSDSLLHTYTNIKIYLDENNMVVVSHIDGNYEHIYNKIDISKLSDNTAKNIALCDTIIDYIISPDYGPKTIYGDIAGDNIIIDESDDEGKTTTKINNTSDITMSINIAQIKYSPVEKYGFINIPYTSTDELGAILKEMSNLEEYDVFIQGDKYWKRENVTKNDLDKLNIAVSPTKYLSLDMTKDVDAAYIKAQYVFSAIKEIYLAFKTIDDETTDKNTNITPEDVRVEIEVDEIGSISPSLVQAFEMCLLLYQCLCTLYRKMNGISSTSPEGNYYGISLPSNIDIGDFSDKINAGIIYNDSSILEKLINEDGFIPNVSSESSDDFKSITKYIEEQRFSERVIIPSDTTPSKNSGHLVMSTIKDISSLLSLAKQKTTTVTDLTLPFIEYIESVSGRTDESGNKLDKEEYIIAIDNMIRFPIEYLLGRMTNPYHDNSLLVNDDYKKWCDEVFKSFYTKSDCNDIFDIIILNSSDNASTTISNNDLSLLSQNIDK